MTPQSLADKVENAAGAATILQNVVILRLSVMHQTAL